MPRRNLSKEECEGIKERASFRCEYCQCWADFSAQSFVYEHIIPVAKGGETVLENLCYACGGCNGHKYIKTEGIDPVSKLIIPLYHPRDQNWNDHFSWSNDYLHIIGLTPTGRATVAALKMNRQPLVNIRTLFVMAGKHPP
ncbi:MAG: HNH endonuclease signature motif containing protein [Chloroflexota bacterium]